MKLKTELNTERPEKKFFIPIHYLAFVFLLLSCVISSALSQEKSTSKENETQVQPSLEKVRLTMDKWIETQQIISKERKDWQQSKDILQGRLELVKKEVSTLKDKIKESKTSVAETDQKKNKLVAENDQLKTAGKQLTEAVTGMEGEIHRISKQLPDPLKTKLQPLYQRIPEDATKTNVTVAERFQNVLGILNELNKSNGEITVNYEVRQLSDGKSSEVKAIYIGLAQAYYVSTRGDAGIGRPTADGWTWEPSKEIAQQLLTTLEILQGKQTPAFVPLPVKIQ